MKGEAIEEKANATPIQRAEAKEADTPAAPMITDVDDDRLDTERGLIIDEDCEVSSELIISPPTFELDF